MRVVRSTIFSAGLAALLVSSCAREQATTPHFRNAPVILISIDTLRSDHLPAYGYRYGATPALDAFRRDAILFRNAWSHCPMTLPSHLSMLTGMLPAQLGVRDNAGFRFDASKHPSVPQLLHARGYATGAAVSAYVLHGDTGMRAMFDDYDDAVDAYSGASFAEFQRPGGITESRAEKWIGAHASQPFFYFFHIYEPHVPYESGSYDGDIAAADAIVGKFLSFLKSSGLYDRALIIITSDHGEGLGDHGEAQHSILIYREDLQVPLFVKLPQSMNAGQERNEVARLTDIAPTILDAAGASDTTATSLLLLPKSRRIYSESLYPRYHFGWSELRSLTDGRWHYIDSPRPELYDITRDPQEKHDLSASERRIASSMRNDLAQFGRDVPTIGEVDPDTAAKLASLGYIGSTHNRESGPLPNPRDEIGRVEELRSALQSNDPIASLRALIARDPRMVEVWVELARTLAERGRIDEAIDAYKQALAHSRVVEPDVALSLAELEADRGDVAGAEKIANAWRAMSRRRADAILVRAALTRKDVAPALQIANEAASAPDAEPLDMLLVADVQIARGDYDAALQAVDAASRRAGQLEIAKVYRLEFLRGDALARMGRVDEARAAYRREIALYPNDAHAYANLAVLELVSGDRKSSNDLLQSLAKIDARLATRTREALQK
jgi:arylsulfatase A-like enzyme/Flp pilus assembly protein TadD